MYDYLTVLSELHRSLLPAVYLEIGVAGGESLRLAGTGTTVIGVDPDVIMPPDDPLTARVVPATSDDFFAGSLPSRLIDGPLDLTFIDGMHLFEYALRDFAHAEQLSHERSLIVLHDCLPNDAATSVRERATDFWTGDVWKLMLCLLDHRPGLDMHILDVPPSGLCLVRALDPADRVLLDDLDALTEAYIGLEFDEWERRLPEVLRRTTDNPESRAWSFRRVVEAERVEEVASLTARLAESREETDLLRGRVADMELQIAAATGLREAAEADNSDLRQRLAAQEARAADLQERLDLVSASLSWRVTAPVRSVGAAFRRTPRG